MSTTSFSSSSKLEFSSDDDLDRNNIAADDDEDDLEQHSLLAQTQDASDKKEKNKKRKQKRREKKASKEELYVQRYMQEMEKQRQAFLQKWREENNSLPIGSPRGSIHSRKNVAVGDRSSSNSTRALDLVQQTASAMRKSISSKVASTETNDDKNNCSITILHRIKSFLATVEVFICNMPLTVGAVGLGWVTMGVVWFKFMEENLDSCIPVRFNSDQCTFPEFPGCFECDTTNDVYRITLAFHLCCNAVGGFCCLLFLLRVVWAWQVVADELKNPATATPMGVVCITMVCVFAGRGWIGELVVIATSAFHFVLAFWFLYQAICEFRLLPDPGWFPNTVGIAYAAIKMWLYYPHIGKFLMALAMLFLFSTYPISLYRVAFTPKIAAPVCFIQLSAPSITMYAMTIMSQPSRQREEQLDASPALMHHYYDLHQGLYLPVQHAMMILSLIAMVSVLQSLYARWPKFKQHEFSPAHVAFVFPILSHSNAVQAYRSGVDAFSTVPNGSPFKVALFSYWFVCLLVGTTVNLIFTCKYVKRLPKWTKLDVGDEDEPPLSPDETMVHEMLVESNVHETMTSQFVSPAVLQANEAGSLIRVRRGSVDWTVHGPFVRTRKVTALGFDLIMSEMELRQERAELLDWVAKNRPRKRQRTLSIPMMMKLKGSSSNGNRNMDEMVYGTFADGGNGGVEHEIGRVSTIGTLTHSRSKTML